jgi:hypothetical protein
MSAAIRLRIPARKRVWTLEVAPRITRDDIRHWMPWSRARFSDAGAAASRRLYDSALGADACHDAVEAAQRENN